MKKIYLSLVSLIGVAGLHAQTINSLHFPSPGDNFTYFLTDTNGIYPGTSGANQVWNFEDLNVDTVMQTDSYLAPIVTTPPVTGHTTVLGDIQNGYTFFKNTATDFTLMGNSDSGNVNVTAFTDPIRTITFPFSFNSTQTDNFSFNITVQGFPVSVTGTVNTVADGSGNLLLPQGAFNNVIRVKTTIVSNISVPLIFNGTQNQTIYEWYDGINKFALLHWEETVTDLAGTITSDRIVWVANTGPAGLNTTQQNVDFSLMPNPAAEQVTILFDNSTAAPTKIAIYNTVGQLVYENNQVNAANNRLTVNTSNFEKGVYFVNMLQDNRTITKKLVVQ
jgi:hypothetical protein